jgi:hypothetical protein
MTIFHHTDGDDQIMIARHLSPATAQKIVDLITSDEEESRMTISHDVSIKEIPEIIGIMYPSMNQTIGDVPEAIQPRHIHDSSHTENQ